MTFATLDPGACADDADRVRALIFILGSFGVAICTTADVANFCRTPKVRAASGAGQSQLRR